MENTMIYIGPTIADTVQTGTAFKGGYPPKVEEAARNRPYLMDLMIPADKLADARKAARDPNSRLGMLCRQAKQGGE